MMRMADAEIEDEERWRLFYRLYGGTEKSCFSVRQDVALADGSIMPAGQVHLAARSSRVDLLGAGRVVASARTIADGRRVTFDDGSTLELTLSHRVWLGTERLQKVFDGRTHLRVMHWRAMGDLQIGDRIQNKTVLRIEEMPGMAAIRLFPESLVSPIHTPSVAVGSRWQEIAYGAETHSAARILNAARAQEMWEPLPRNIGLPKALVYHDCPGRYRAGGHQTLGGFLDLVWKVSREPYAVQGAVDPAMLIMRDLELTPDDIAGLTVPSWDFGGLLHKDCGDIVDGLTGAPEGLARAV